jgi:hypothetical protein
LKLNEALLFRDCMDQTIAEGLHTMRTGGQDAGTRAYAAFLAAARPLLLEAKDADFGAQHHAFVADCLRHAAESLKGKFKGGDWQAQAFLLGYGEGVCAVAHRLEKGPLLNPDQLNFVLAELAVQQAQFAAEAMAKAEPAQRRAYVKMCRALGRCARDTLKDLKKLKDMEVSIPLLDVCYDLYGGVMTAFEIESHQPPEDIPAKRWEALCEEAHLRLRSFVSGCTHALQATYAGTARQWAWTWHVQAGRLARSRADSPHNWWLREAYGILGTLRARSYWSVPGAVDTAAAEAFVTQVASRPAPPQQLLLRLADLKATNPLSERIKAWIEGAADGARSASKLPPGPVAKTWLASLRSALPGLDVEGLLEGVDVSREPDGHCGHGKAHRLYEEFVARYCKAQGADATLPEKPEDARLLGLVRGHHVFSLPHEAHSHTHAAEHAQHSARPDASASGVRPTRGGPTAPQGP